MISLSYCYLNSEVQGVVRSHWRRWIMVRRVGREVDRVAVGSSSYFLHLQCSRGGTGSSLYAGTSLSEMNVPSPKSQQQQNNKIIHQTHL